MKLKYLLFVFFIVCLESKAESTINGLSYYQSESIVYVNIETSIELSETVVDAIKNGLTLNVGYAFKFSEAKWYKFVDFAELEKNYLISYDNISNNFILENPVTSNVTNYPSINLLLHKISNLRDFPLISSTHLIDKKVEGEVRFQLNTGNLPVYLKADAFFSADWNIDSDWYQWQLN